MYIEKIREDNKCIGCRNCENVCPTGAVKIIPDNKGFFVPLVSHDQCISCGRCEKSCPTNGLRCSTVQSFPVSIVIQNTDREQLIKTASGGLCTILAQYIIKERNGFVCGAIYDDEYRVKHIVTSDLTDLNRMRQSKYVQSDLGNCFSSIRDLLLRDAVCLFIGTTCQVYALIKYLNGKPSNLYCIDLICHGAPSPLVQREYIRYLNEKYGKVTEISNRYKKLYRHSYVSVYATTFDNGKTITRRYSDDPMADAFFSHLSVRDSCFDCQFKTVNRISDLTVGDFWFSEKYGFGEDLYGVNLCLIQSKNGHDLIDAIKSHIKYMEVDTRAAVLLNGGMIYSSCPKNKNRDRFFNELGNTEFNSLVKKYDGISKKMRLKYYIREWIAPILRRTKYYNRQLSQNAERRLKRVLPEEKIGLTYYE